MYFVWDKYKDKKIKKIKQNNISRTLWNMRNPWAVLVQESKFKTEEFFFLIWHLDLERFVDEKLRWYCFLGTWVLWNSFSQWSWPCSSFGICRPNLIEDIKASCLYPCVSSLWSSNHHCNCFQVKHIMNTTCLRHLLRTLREKHLEIYLVHNSWNFSWLRIHEELNDLTKDKTSEGGGEAHDGKGVVGGNMGSAVLGTSPVLQRAWLCASSIRQSEKSHLHLSHFLCFLANCTNLRNALFARRIFLNCCIYVSVNRKKISK